MKPSYQIKFIALCCLISLLFLCRISAIAQECTDCHEYQVKGNHAALTCTDCHLPEFEHKTKPGNFGQQAKSCISCHDDAKGMLNSKMHTRSDERTLINKIFKHTDQKFYKQNCSGCHVSSCMDCHKMKPDHEIAKPDTNDCLKCHNDYYTGIEYTGRGVREDHDRYQRGEKFRDTFYQQMLPDVHHEKGMECRECHSMKSLAQGNSSSKTCTDCHTIDNRIIEHRITAHTEKMECYSCHSAWASQEYGTYWLRFNNSANQKYFRYVKDAGLFYQKSSHTKVLGPPPLGINERGLVSPIRPQFIHFYSAYKNNKIIGKENRLLGNHWMPFFPHTIRRETVHCESCHYNDRRLMSLPDNESLYNLSKDGLPFPNFYNSQYHEMVKGRFLTEEEVQQIQKNSPQYQKELIEKTQQVIKMLRKND